MTSPGDMSASLGKRSTSAWPRAAAHRRPRRIDDRPAAIGACCSDQRGAPISALRYRLLEVDDGDAKMRCRALLGIRRSSI